MSSPLATAEPWSLVATAYDELVMPMFTPFARHALENVALGAPPLRALDVACGPGTVTALLAGRGYEVDAIDFCQPMIDQLRLKLDDAGRLNGAVVRTYVMDGQDLQFADASFDVAFSMFGLMFFPDRARGFAELYRVLKPGGRTCVSSWPPLSEVPAMRWAFGAFNAVLPTPDRPAPAREPVLEDATVFRSELEQAGFKDVRVERVHALMPVFDIEAFWEGMVRSSAPVALYRKKVGEARWADMNAKALAHLRATAPSDLSTLGMEAWLGFGVKPQG